MKKYHLEPAITDITQNHTAMWGYGAQVHLSLWVGLPCVPLYHFFANGWLFSRFKKCINVFFSWFSYHYPSHYQALTSLLWCIPPPPCSRCHSWHLEASRADLNQSPFPLSQSSPTGWPLCTLWNLFGPFFLDLFFVSMKKKKRVVGPFCPPSTLWSDQNFLVNGWLVDKGGGSYLEPSFQRDIFWT